MSIDTNMKTTLSIYTLKYYSATKQNEIIILAAAWMNQEIIILCKVSQRQTDKHPRISRTGGIDKVTPMKRNSLRKPNSDYQKKKLEGIN